jgi:hypothetical protein
MSFRKKKQLVQNASKRTPPHQQTPKHKQTHPTQHTTTSRPLGRGDQTSRRRLRVVTNEVPHRSRSPLQDRAAP